MPETKVVVVRVWSSEWPEGGGKKGDPVTAVPLELPAEVQQLLDDGWRIASHSTAYAGLSLMVTFHLERDQGAGRQPRP